MGSLGKGTRGISRARVDLTLAQAGRLLAVAKAALAAPALQAMVSKERAPVPGAKGLALVALAAKTVKTAKARVVAKVALTRGARVAQVVRVALVARAAAGISARRVAHDVPKARKDRQHQVQGAIRQHPQPRILTACAKPLLRTPGNSCNSPCCPWVLKKPGWRCPSRPKAVLNKST